MVWVVCTSFFQEAPFFIKTKFCSCRSSCRSQYITTNEATQKQAVTRYSQFFPTFAKLTHDSSNDLATLITYANLSGHHITGNL